MNSTTDFSSAFLSNTERQKIQRMFEKWNQSLEPRVVAGAMFENNIIRPREKQAFNAKLTDYERNEFLFETALIRATYAQIQMVRHILVETGADSHIILARMLPVRDHDDFWVQYHKTHGGPSIVPPPLPQTSQQPAAPVYPTQQHPAAPVYPTQQPAAPVYPTQQQPMDTGDILSQGVQERSGTFNNSATNACRSDNSDHQRLQQYIQPNMHHLNMHQQQPQMYQHQPQIPQPQQPMHAAPNQQGNAAQSLSDILGRYATRGPTPQGYCLIIANYTKEPKTGFNYMLDVAALKSIFQDVLKFQVQVVYNQTKIEMESELQKTQQLLNQYAYDRFFLFVMSHGDDDGIKTCKPDGVNSEYIINNGLVERDENNQPKCEHITVETIISMFTHNHVAGLRDFPKVFFIQACDGDRVAYAAGGEESSSSGRKIARAACGAEKITVGADVLVCHACQKGHYAWVDDTGSWLIQELVTVLHHYHQREHLLDMLTEVNRRISRKSMPGIVNATRHHEVRQLPVIAHNLTQKLYL